MKKKTKNIISKYSTELAVSLTVVIMTMLGGVLFLGVQSGLDDYLIAEYRIDELAPHLDAVYSDIYDTAYATMNTLRGKDEAEMSDWLDDNNNQRKNLKNSCEDDRIKAALVDDFGDDYLLACKIIK